MPNVGVCNSVLPDVGIFDMDDIAIHYCVFNDGCYCLKTTYAARDSLLTP